LPGSVGEVEAIAAGGFGVVERVVGPLDHGLEVLKWVAYGHTDADGDV